MSKTQQQRKGQQRGQSVATESQTETRYIAPEIPDGKTLGVVQRDRRTDIIGDSKTENLKPSALVVVHSITHDGKTVSNPRDAKDMEENRASIGRNVRLNGSFDFRKGSPMVAHVASKGDKLTGYDGKTTVAKGTEIVIDEGHGRVHYLQGLNAAELAQFLPSGTIPVTVIRRPLSASELLALRSDHDESAVQRPLTIIGKVNLLRQWASIDGYDVLRDTSTVAARLGMVEQGRKGGERVTSVVPYVQLATFPPEALEYFSILSDVDSGRLKRDSKEALSLGVLSLTDVKFGDSKKGMDKQSLYSLWQADLAAGRTWRSAGCKLRQGIETLTGKVKEKKVSAGIDADSLKGLRTEMANRGQDAALPIMAALGGTAKKDDPAVTIDGRKLFNRAEAIAYVDEASRALRLVQCIETVLTKEYNAKQAAKLISAARKLADEPVEPTDNE